MKLPANLKFEDWPENLGRKDYEDVLALAVADLKKNQDVAAVYSMGQNWVPGLSDLDMVVVYRDGTKKIHAKDPRTLSGKAGSVFTHGYMHFDVRTFKNLYYIYPGGFDLSLLFGEDIILNDPSKELSREELSFLQSSLVFDFLVTKVLLLPRFFQVDPNKTTLIKVREMLLFLYSFTHTITNTERWTGQKINSAFSEEIRDLRNNWFARSQEENQELLKKAVVSGFEVAALLVEVWDIFLKTAFGQMESPAQLEFASPDFNIVGVADWQPEDFWKTFSQERIRIKVPTLRKVINCKLLVPRSFFLMFSLYTQGQGPYSRWFKKFLKGGSISAIKSAGIDKRIEIINQIPLKESGEALFTLPFHYGFHTSNYFKDWLITKAVVFKRFLKLWQK